MTISPIIFISYSWDSDEHKQRVFNFSQALRVCGLDTRLDQDQETEQPLKDWLQWTADQIKKSNVVLMVCTETYHRQATDEEELDIGLTQDASERQAT